MIKCSHFTVSDWDWKILNQYLYIYTVPAGKAGLRWVGSKFDFTIPTPRN